MSDTRKTQRSRLLFLFACLVAWVALAFYNGRFEPAPERDTAEATQFVYYGEQGETLPAPDVSATEFDVARAALHNSDYFGAYAAGSGGRSGVWTGARTIELARTYALARCGEGCRIVAERLPLHRDPARMEPILTHAMAQNMAVRKSIAARNVIAFGGANAWGHSGRLGIRAGGLREMRRIAIEDCEMRRAAEITPTAEISPPCRYLFLTEIIDLRPQPELYPAPYTVDLTELAQVDATVLRRRPDAPREPFFGSILPSRLYGARAVTGDGTDQTVREAGWAEAGEALALMLCNADRRPAEGPCVIAHTRLPEATAPDGVLQVTADVYAAFVSWRQTTGAGAFALSPYGVWGTSSGWEDVDFAIQRAADRCLYYSRRTWVERQVSEALLDPDLPCRIVAMRDG